MSIETVQGASGPKARIAGHRVRVMDVAIWHERQGMSVDDIVRDYPTLTAPEIEAALAYYRDHRDAIDRFIADEEAAVADVRRGHRGPLAEHGVTSGDAE